MFWNKNKNFIFVLLGVNLIFLYFYFIKGFFVNFGFLFGTTYFVLISVLFHKLLKKILIIKNERWLNWFFSVLFSFLLFSLVSSSFIIFYKLNNFFIWFSYVLVGVLLWFVLFFSKKVKDVKPKFIKEEARGFVFFETSWPLLILYLLLWVVGLALLLDSRTSQHLFSPWQTINMWYLPVFFASMILVGLFIFSKSKTWIIICVLILQTVLTHMYLPISHTLPWGGDVWRHLAVEQKIANEEAILPNLFGEDVEWTEVLKADIPTIFVAPQKYSYGQMWGTNVVLSKTFGFKLQSLHIWLVPLLWSIFIPVILYVLGFFILKSRRFAFLLVWFGLLPFPFQALGSLTLPVSFGFITFISTLLLWVNYFFDKKEKKENKKWQKAVAVLFSILMLFSYSMYFIILWMLLLSIYVFGILKEKIQNNKTFSFSMFGVMILGSFVIPIIELLGKTATWPAVWNIKENTIQFVGQFSGWYFARAIRPHDILSGNLFFNHTPDWAFVSSVFTSWRWHVIFFVVFIWLVSTFGFICKFYTKNKNVFMVLFLALSTFGAYKIGWFFLDGNRQIIRRLDIVLVFAVLTLFLMGLKSVCLTEKWKNFGKKMQYSFTLFFIVGFSFFTTTTFASGPDIQVASWFEEDMAQSIWKTLMYYNEKSEDVCILADTWILLPLETVSSREIVGGNLPIDTNYGQTELLELYSEMKTIPSENTIDKIFALGDYKRCYAVIDSSNAKFNDFASKSDRITNYFKNLSLRIWRIENKNLK